MFSWRLAAAVSIASTLGIVGCSNSDSSPDPSPAARADAPGDTGPAAPAGDASASPVGADASASSDAGGEGHPGDAGDAGRSTDAADGGDPGDAGPHPPRETALALWLDTDTSVTSNASNEVSAWADRTGKIPTSFRTTNAPILEANGIGSHRAIRFDHNAIDGLTPAKLGTVPIAVFMVVRTLVPGTFTMIFNAAANGVFMLADTANDTPSLLSMKAGSSTLYANPAITGFSSKARVLGVRRQDAFYEARVDGATAALTNPNGVLGVLQDLKFGDESTGVLLGDVLVYEDALTPAEVSEAEAFLKAKYGL